MTASTWSQPSEVPWEHQMLMIRMLHPTMFMQVEAESDGSEMSWEPEFDEGLWDESDWEQIVTDNEDWEANATWEERTTHNIQLFLKFMEYNRKKEGPLPAITEGVCSDTKLP